MLLSRFCLNGKEGRPITVKINCSSYLKKFFPITITYFSQSRSEQFGYKIPFLKSVPEKFGELFAIVFNEQWKRGFPPY